MTRQKWFLKPDVRFSILISKIKYFISGKISIPHDHEFNNSYISTNDSLADTAMKFINSPYIWGGRIPSGIDCSGLTQLVYKIHGIPIPRDSWQQAEAGRSY